MENIHTGNTTREGLDKDIAISLENLNELCKTAGLEKQMQELCSYALGYVDDIQILSSLSTSELSTQDQVSGADQNRTLRHNAVFDQVKIVVRNLRDRGVDVSWAQKLSSPDGSLERLKCGRFAVQLAYQISKTELQRYPKS